MKTLKVRKILEFLGHDVKHLLALGFMVGAIFFAAELGFAFSIRAFLTKLGGQVGGDIHLPLPEWIPQDSLGFVLTLLLFMGLVRGLLQWAQTYLRGASNEYLKYFHRKKLLHWALNSTSVSSSYATALFNERINAAGILVMSAQGIVICLTAATFLVLSLFAISISLTLVALILLGFFAYPMRKLDNKISIAGKGLVDEWDKTNSRLMMSIKNLLLIQIYGTQKSEEETAQKSLKAYLAHALSYLKVSGLKYALPQIVGVALICLLSLLAASKGLLTSSLLVAYFYLFVRFIQNVSECLRLSVDMRFYSPQFDQLLNWWQLDLDQKIHIGKQSHPHQFSQNPLGWELKNVNFQYPATNKKIFENLNLTIKPGEFLTITGASGVGKSTLMGLLLGGLKPSGGEVEVSDNGSVYNLNNVGTSFLRNVGYAGPDSFLLEGSILSNLIYGLDQTPKEEELQRALKQAECQFVFDLPMGLKTQLTEQGHGLSAGQKQRLSLARALLRNPKVLILDEATANLDSTTENRLAVTLGGFKGKITIIATTHREALLRIADNKLYL